MLLPKWNKVVTVCLLCCISIEGTCANIPVEALAASLLPKTLKNLTYVTLGVPHIPSMKVEEAMDALSDLIRNADNPLDTTCQFFQSFLDQLNAQDGSAITIVEACEKLRDQKEMIPVEYRKAMLAGVDLIESRVNPLLQLPGLLGIQHGPWDWEWDDIEDFWYSTKSKVKENWRSFQQWLGLRKEGSKNQHVAAWAIDDPYRVAVFALIVAGIFYVAVHHPESLQPALDAMIKTSQVMFG